MMRALLLCLLTFGACIEEDEHIVVDVDVEAYTHLDVAPPEGLPTCEEMGCDGTQSVPLYCPTTGKGPCFCAAPDGTDGWCLP